MVRGFEGLSYKCCGTSFVSGYFPLPPGAARAVDELRGENGCERVLCCDGPNGALCPRSGDFGPERLPLQTGATGTQIQESHLLCCPLNPLYLNQIPTFKSFNICSRQSIHCPYFNFNFLFSPKVNDMKKMDLD